MYVLYVWYGMVWYGMVCMYVCMYRPVIKRESERERELIFPLKPPCIGDFPLSCLMTPEGISDLPSSCQGNCVLPRIRRWCQFTSQGCHQTWQAGKSPNYKWCCHVSRVGMMLGDCPRYRQARVLTGAVLSGTSETGSFEHLSVLKFDSLMSTSN